MFPILQQLAITSVAGISSAIFTGDNMGEALEDFLARNTLVEFTHIEFTDPKGGEGNIITTSHNEGIDIGSGGAAEYLMNQGVYIKKVDHSHTGKEDLGAQPSGIDPRDIATQQVIGTGHRGGDMLLVDRITDYDPLHARVCRAGKKRNGDSCSDDR